MNQDDNRPPESPKIIIAHRYTLVRQAFAHLVLDLGLGPVMEAASPSALLRLISRHRPEVVLVEWDMAPDPEQIAARIASAPYHPSVVALVRPESRKRLQSALKAGVSGYLSFNITADELGDTLRLLERGNVIVSSEMAGALSGQEQTPSGTEPGGGLSEREREVLGLVASGATNREIAEALVVTENTVKVHLRNVLDKLHLRNRQQAAVFAVQEGIVVETKSSERSN